MSHLIRASSAVIVVLLASFVGADSPTERLEKGIYAEETQGDLAAAIAIYEELTGAAQPDRETTAHALLRLGACYVKTGRMAEAKAAFDKLAQQYPEQKALIAKVPDTTIGALPLGPVPWAEDETLVMTRDSGFRIARIRQERRGDNLVARLDGYTVAGTFSDYSTIEAFADTFRPIQGIADATPWRPLRVTFSCPPGRLEIVRWEKDGPQTETRPLPSSHAVRGGLDWYLVRRLPLAPGYRVTIPFVSPWSPQIDQVTIEVLGKETVTVPAGTFECFKIEWHWPRFDTFGWYSADSHRYPVKTQYVGTGKAELMEVRVGPHGGPVALEGADVDARLTLPNDWFFVKTSPAVARMIAPEVAVVGGVQRLSADEQPEDTTPRLLATRYLDSKRNDATFKVREEAVDLHRHGLDGTRIVADKQDGLLEYSLWLVRGEHRARLWFEIKMDAWDKFKPVVDEIAASVRLE